MASTLFAPDLSAPPAVELRDYQQEAVDAVWQYAQERRGDGNPLVSLPTGTGKSLVAGALCRDIVGWGHRAIVVVPSRELVEQNARAIEKMVPGLEVGVQCSGLGRFDTEPQVISASIHTLYKRIDSLQDTNVLIIDEAHRIPPKDEGKLYRGLLDRFDDSFVIGLTATPFRLKTGLICGPDHLFQEIAYEAPLLRMIDEGWLSPLRSYEPVVGVGDASRARVRAGEFVVKDLEEIFSERMLVHRACKQIVEAARGRQSILVFACGVEHASVVREKLIELTEEPVEAIFGTTRSEVRTETIERFKAGDLRFLVNVDTLTTGFDAPSVDLIALLRPTMSPGLLVQMCGRGSRLAEGKDDCKILDFAGNFMRHGPLDAIRPVKPSERGSGEAPAKVCPGCRAIVHAAVMHCRECGHQFEPPEGKGPPHAGEQTQAPVTTRERVVTETWFDVSDVTYSVHVKKNAKPGKPKQTLRVKYELGVMNHRSEWICIEHAGFARRKAERWWSKRSAAPCPRDVGEAIELAQSGKLAETTRILVRKTTGEKYDEIVDHELSSIPPYTPTEAVISEVFGEVPF